MIVSLVEALVDLIYGPGDETSEAHVGGSPFNVAIALSRMGSPAGLICPLSTDEYGDRLAQTLHQEGVAVCTPTRVDAPTAIAEVRTDAHGHPSYTFYRTGTADRALDKRPPNLCLPPTLTALHFGSLVLAQGTDWPAWREAIVAARQRGAFIAFDPNLRPALIDDMDAYRARLEDAVELADLIKASDEDLSLLGSDREPEGWVEEWRSDSRVVVLTQGARGAQMWGHGLHVTQQPSGGLAIADTVGAGDTFQAGLLAGFMARPNARAPFSEAEAIRLLRFATEAALITCSRSGCQPPFRHEIERRLSIQDDSN